mgnify:CR=1 FL=1
MNDYIITKHINALLDATLIRKRSNKNGLELDVKQRNQLRYVISAGLMSSQSLVDKVIDQMKSDIESNDWTSIEGLLILIEPDLLKGFLSD